MEPQLNSFTTMSFVGMLSNFRNFNSGSTLLQHQDANPDHEIAKEGLSKFGFFIGVLAVCGYTFMLGRWPQHSWLVLLGCLIVAPFPWYYHVTRFRFGAYLWIELRWFASLFMIMYLILVYQRALEDFQLMVGFRFMFMWSTGFLSWCTVSFNSFLCFYSRERLVNLFIHAMPITTLLAMRQGNGFSPAVQEDWPDYFPLTVWEETKINELVVICWFPYFLWFIPYSVWLFRRGVDLHSEGYSTSFHHIYIMRFMPLVRRRFPSIVNMRCHVFLYLICHFICFSASSIFALLCWYYVQLHTVWVALIIYFSVVSGADHYIRISCMKFGPILTEKEGRVAAQSQALDAHRRSRIIASEQLKGISEEGEEGEDEVEMRQYGT